MLGLAELVPGHSRGISVVSSDIVTVVGRGTEKKKHFPNDSEVFVCDLLLLKKNGPRR